MDQVCDSIDSDISTDKLEVTTAPKFNFLYVLLHRLRNELNKTRLVVKGLGSHSRDSSEIRPKSNESEIEKSIVKSLANVKAKIAQKIRGGNSTKPKKVEKSVKRENQTQATIHDVKCPQSLLKLCAVDEEAAEQLIR